MHCQPEQPLARCKRPSRFGLLLFKIRCLRQQPLHAATVASALRLSLNRSIVSNKKSNRSSASNAAITSVACTVSRESSVQMAHERAVMVRTSSWHALSRQSAASSSISRGFAHSACSMTRLTHDRGSSGFAPLRASSFSAVTTLETDAWLPRSSSPHRGSEASVSVPCPSGASCTPPMVAAGRTSSRLSSRLRNSCVAGTSACDWCRSSSSCWRSSRFMSQISFAQAP
mmetsp:Transcript_19314/g.32774  ORF Transcript_19314/g.32774 Transcript_19314/m.32774 type:complete len:229 (+) Transcript_19314:214-900(+)